MFSRKNLSRNSKGGVGQDLMTIIIVIFVFGFTSLIGYTLFDSMVTQYQSMDIYDSDMDTAVNRLTIGMNMFDKVIGVILAAMIIALGVASYKIATPPIFFLITIIMAAFYGTVSYFFNYIFQQIASQSVFDLVRVHFPITILICTNLHWIMLISIIVGSITLFAKRDQGQYV